MPIATSISVLNHSRKAQNSTWKMITVMGHDILWGVWSFFVLEFTMFPAFTFTKDLQKVRLF